MKMTCIAGPAILLALASMGQRTQYHYAWDAPGQNIGPDIGPCVHYSGLVKGEPFEARYEQSIPAEPAEGNAPSAKLYGTIARDAEGRTRWDLHAAPGDTVPRASPAGEPSLIFLHNYPRNARYILYPVYKVFERLPGGIPGSSQPGGWEFGVPTTQDTQETMQIGGLTCRKVLLKTHDGQSGYSWVSDELKEAMLEQIGTRYSYRLTEIVRGEPDPRQFEIPPDYKEVPHGWNPPGVPAPR